MLPKRAKPFLAAYYVLQVLEEHDVKRVAIYMGLDGACSLLVDPRDYQKGKTVAESLLKTQSWYMDNYGNYCLGSQTALIEEEEIVDEKEKVSN